MTPTAHKKTEHEPVKSATSKAKAVRRNYLYAVGRRKESVARARFYRRGEGKIMVNNKPVEAYFPYHLYREIAVAAITTLGLKNEGDFTIRVVGGGVRGQAEAVRLSIARLLVKIEKDNRPVLKKAGYLKRDPRSKERKKYGLKGARRAPQWQKR